MFKGIDLFSDTMTRPTDAMRQAMMDAPVGDEQEGEDPTTLKLEERCAEMLGHTSAMFFPSATMSNQVAAQLHCRPGDEFLAAETAHIFNSEAGGLAASGGINPKRIPTKDGLFTGEDIRVHRSVSHSPHTPPTTCVAVENTSNMGGGIVWPREQLDDVVRTAKKLDMKVHLDGARIFNAALASGCEVGALTGLFDSVTVCFSKGLGCPTGAVLGFNKKHWPVVRRLKQRLGGAMRQSGILSACALYALDNHVSRLVEDHKNAGELAKGLDGIPHIRVETPEPASNMVFFHWTHESVPSPVFAKKVEALGVRFSSMGQGRFRAVTHLDVSPEAVRKAVEVVREVAGGL